MQKQIFSLYEQLSNHLEDQTLVEFTYAPKPDGSHSDSHSIHLGLRRPDDVYDFAEIVIEIRNGRIQILVWPQPETMGNDPIIYHPDPDKSPYCLKCGWDWSVHENGCVTE